jgi:hypothetical protein
MPDIPDVVPAPWRIYIAGPLTGKTEVDIENNIEAARKWWDHLIALGHYPFCPHLLSGHKTRTQAEMEASGIDEEYAMWVEGYDYAWLELCDALFLMPTWKSSRGAQMEEGRAKQLHLHVIYDISQMPRIDPDCPKPTILQEAQALVYGDRQEAYGHPEEDYTQEAAMLSALWMHKLKDPLTPHEAALGMVTLKVRRSLFRPLRRDNYVDMAGYAEVAARVVGEDK